MSDERPVSPAIDTRPAAAPPLVEVERLELKPFLLAAVLWLPLAFFVWFALRSAVVYPVIRLVAAVLGAWMPDLVSDVRQVFHDMGYSVLAEIGRIGAIPGERLYVDLQINVLPYCYSIPLLMGLSIATPISWARTFVQLAIGIPILVAVQAFGVLGEVLRRMQFDMAAAVSAAVSAEGFAAEAPAAGAAAQANVVAALAAHGTHPEAIALWYQFGYLILPSISAVILWILFNRRFIEALRFQR